MKLIFLLSLICFSLSAVMSDDLKPVDDLKSSEGDFKSAVADFKSSEDDFKSALGDFKSSDDDFKSAVGDFKSADDDFKSAVDTSQPNDGARKDYTETDDLEYRCHPKVPLIEPLIASGLLGSNSRLPVKLQEKLKNKSQQKMQQVNLVCKRITGMEEGEYFCKSKRSIGSYVDSDYSKTADYESGPDFIEDYY